MPVHDCPHMCPEHIPNNSDCRLCRTIFLLWGAARQNNDGMRELLQVELASRMHMAEAIMSDPGQQAMLIFGRPLTENNKGQLRHRFGSASVYITEHIARLSAVATKQYHKQCPWRDGDRPLNRLIVYMQGGLA